MLQEFPWYFQPSKGELEAAWSKGLLVVDTNVLLDIYRSPAESSEQIIVALERWSANKWLPYTVAEEFLKNRKNIVADERHSTNSCIAAVDKLLVATKSSAGELKHSYRRSKSALDCLISDIEKSKKAFVEKLKSEDRIRNLSTDDDPIMNRILSVFSGFVGSKPKDDDLDRLYNEAKARYESEIPPGYKDSKNKPVPDVYNDFIIWTTALERAKSLGCNLVFVTSETKEDWMYKVDGEHQPLVALLKEGFERTGRRVIIYRPDQFVKISGERSDAPVSGSVLSEIKGAEDRRVIAEATKAGDVKRSLDQALAEMSIEVSELERKKTYWNRRLFLRKEENYEGLIEGTVAYDRKKRIVESDIATINEHVVENDEKLANARVKLLRLQNLIDDMQIEQGFNFDFNRIDANNIRDLWAY